MVEYSIESGRAYAVLKVWLKPGESVTLEPGAYMLHKGDVDVETSSRGILRGVLRALFGGESFFLNTVTARSDVELWIAPSIPGDIAAIDISNGELLVQDMSYLAHIGDVEVGVAWKGFRGLLAEGELVWLRLRGTGTVFVNSYGAIEELRLGYGERMVVDNMHFVALDSTVKWRIRKWGSWKTFIFGGEGIVVELTGPGRVWVQTRSLPVLARILAKYMPRG